MIGEALVFDCVAHVFNFEEKNAFGPAGKMFSNHLYAFHNALTPAGQTIPSRRSTAWSTRSPTPTCSAPCRCRSPTSTATGCHRGRMDGAAANFPDLNFVIFHVGLPFLDEVCWQLIRYGYPQLTEQAKR
ncbi:MAG: hypothetical protein ACRD0A_11540 [Acidimicrobiales bacterium]